MSYSQLTTNAHIYSKDSLSGISQRAAFLTLVPLSLITSITDVVTGVFGILAEAATLGNNEQLVKGTNVQLKASRFIACGPYLNLLKAINPHAPFTKRRETIGYLAKSFITPTFKMFTTCKKSPRLFHRQISTRLTVALSLVAATVSRVLDAIISLIAAPLSIVTFGKFQRINDIALNALKAPGLIFDLHYSTLLFINPFAIKH